MKVPLALYVNGYKTEVVSNSKVNRIEYPFRPYFYLKEKKEFDNCERIMEEKFCLKEMKDRYFYKYEFDSPKSFMAATRWNEEMPNYPNGLSVNHLIYVEKPEFIQTYPNTDELKKMVLDIEVLSDGSATFPTADRIPIFAIGVSMNGEYKVFYNNTEDDSQLLQDFVDYFRKADPDIIAGYNHKKFDLPYIIARCKKHKIDYESAFKRIPDYWNKHDEFVGRVLMDLMWEVKADLSVRGLPNNKLETVGRHFGYEAIEMETDIKANFKKYYNDPDWKDKILKYLYNDVDICVNLLEKNYLLGKTLLAEDTNVPLNEVMITGTTFVPKIFCNRMMKELNYVAVTKNEDLPYFYGKYEGAKSRIYKPKVFLKQPVHHYDFSSMYPSIMMSLNLSPDTVSFVSMERKPLPIEQNELGKIPTEMFLADYKFEDLGDSINFTYPDKGDKELRIVTVNILKKEGYLVSAMRELYEKRQVLNEIYKAKRRNNEEYHLDFSKQYMLKTQLNSIYGAQGSEFGYFTEYLIGPIVTAFGRYLITLIESFVGQETVAEIDTDGLYSTTLADKKDLNERLNVIIDRILPGLIQKSYLGVDFDIYKKGYFYKAKNYVLVDENNNLKVKGNSMKSSRNCKMVNMLFKEIIHRFIEKEEPIEIIAENLIDFEKYTLSDFALKITVKAKNLYKSQTCLSRQLIQQVEDKTGEKDSSGKQIYYVVCKDKEMKYKILENVESLTELDLDYYHKAIMNVLERFGYTKKEDTSQMTLESFINLT